MRFWKSVEILEKATKGYERSKIDVKRYEIPFILLSVNLCARYEEIDRFEDSIHLTDKVIKNLISCKRGDELGFLVEEKTYTTDRMTGNNAKSIEKYRQSYRLMKNSMPRYRSDSIRTNAYESRRSNFYLRQYCKR